MDGAGRASGAVRRAGLSGLALAVVAALLIRLAWQAGGYFPTSYLQAGGIACVALAALLVVFRPDWRFSTHALFALGALAGLAAWTALSATWAPVPSRAVQAMQRDVLYVALFALGLLAAGSGRYARAIPWTVLAVASVIVGAGLLSRLEPNLVGTPIQAPGLSNGRLGYPLGYWNAYGGLAAMLTVLACGLAGDPKTHPLARAPAAGVSLLAFVAMYLSLSRGAWLALIVGALVLLAVSAYRGSLLVSAGIVGAASVLAVSRLQSYHQLTGSAADLPHAGAGHAFAGQLAVLLAVVVVAQWLVAAGRSSQRLMAAMGRVGRPVTAVVAGVALLAAITVYAVHARSVEGHAANGLDRSSGFISRQWRDFMRPAVQSKSGTSRLVTAKGTRSDLYRVAIDGFEAHPLRGDGAGGFQVRWARTRHVGEDVRNAHSLELETLGELGLVGILLLLAFLAAIVVAAVRSRVRPGGLGRGQTAAAAAGIAVWVAHSFVDWDWQMPAVTGCALLLAAPLFPYGRLRRRRRPLPESGPEADPDLELPWSRVGRWREGRATEPI